jgi:serpin B
MCLINALAFDAKWEEKYDGEDIEEGIFTKADSDTQTVTFMSSTENKYIKDGNAKGFIKYYKDQKYAFAALLPDEDINLSEYIKSLNGDRLYNLLSFPEETDVKVKIPQFETEYSNKMNDTLKNMGMGRAFDIRLAQFQGIGSSTQDNIFIGDVIHKTFISVGEEGTKAAAATAVIMDDFSGSAVDSTPTVYLDRPFVYMLIDTENNIPFFIGTMNEIKK